MLDCNNICQEKFWKNHYMIAQQRFDKVVMLLSVGTIVAFIVAVACLIATICTIVRFQAFIAQFEYYEETEYTIEQSEGINTAIIGDENGVIINGTENN